MNGFGELLVGALRELRRSFEMLAGRGMDPADLEQTVALRVWRHAQRNGPPRKLRNFCLIVARREAAPRTMKERRPMLTGVDLSLRRSYVGCPIEAAERQEDAERVDAALRSLPTHYADRLVDHYWNGNERRNGNQKRQLAARARRKVLAALVGDGR